jgi:hypothetical protein
VKLRLTLAIGLAGLALSGCGGSSENAVEKAALQTLAASGARTSFTGTMRIPGAPRLIAFSGSGSIDNRRRRAHVDVDLSGLAAAAGGTIGDPSTFRGQEIVDASGSTILYLRFPYFATRLKTEKPWIRLDVEEQLERSGFNAGSLALNQGNPGQYLDYLRSTTGTVRRVGTEDVSGVSTTHYSATVDLLEYPTKVPSPRRGEAQRASGRLIQLAGMRDFPTEVWVDGSGYVRQLTFFYSVTVPGSDEKIEYHTTVQYRGFGSQPPIVLPPARQVTRIGANGSVTG